MKIYCLAIAVTALLMTGCENPAASTIDITETYQLPAKMKDCNVFHMSPAGQGYRLFAIHCPDAKVATVTEAKSPTKTTVISGNQGAHE